MLAFVPGYTLRDFVFHQNSPLPIHHSPLTFDFSRFPSKPIGRRKRGVDIICKFRALGFADIAPLVVDGANQ